MEVPSRRNNSDVCKPRGLQKTLRIAAGVAVALLLSEAGFRLAFNECEANGNYWGRGAFASDAELGYHHAPNVTAYVARYGSFGPHAIRFNSGGYRDLREPPSAPSSGARVLVAGASLVVGLGLEDDADLFHVRLEEILKRDTGRDDVEAYSIGQTGYWIDQICTLTRRELDRYAPDLVVVSVPGHMATDVDGERRAVSVVNGYRLSPGRVLAGTPLDELRTRSRLYMRLANSKMLRSIARAFGLTRHQSTDYDPTKTPECLAELKRTLDERGVPLVIMLIADEKNAETNTAEETLAAAGFDVVRAPVGPPWSYGNDGHWNAAGHEHAAELVAARIVGRPLLSKAAKEGGG
jgi:hypothetical protein